MSKPQTKSLTPLYDAAVAAVRATNSDAMFAELAKLEPAVEMRLLREIAENRQIEMAGVEIRLRYERRLGQLIREMEKPP